MFVPVQLFKLSLMFEGKAGAYLTESPFRSKKILNRIIYRRNVFAIRILIKFIDDLDLNIVPIAVIYECLQ